MMRKIAILLPVAALLATTGAAMAVDVYSGRIASMDSQTGALTLTNGGSFKISQPVLLKGLHPGEIVDVTVNDDKTVGLSEDSGNFE